LSLIVAAAFVELPEGIGTDSVVGLKERQESPSHWLANTSMIRRAAAARVGPSMGDESKQDKQRRG
jgi:hypothetical protein